MGKILYSSSNLLSHPDKLLETHLIQTAELSEIFLKEKGNIADVEKLLPICKVIGLSHDLGKATGYFQDYLRVTDNSKKEKLKNRRETHHSLFSAICSYYLVKEVISCDLYPFFAYVAVKRHHGNFKDMADEVLLNNTNIELCRKQLKSIDTKKFDTIALKLQKQGLPFLIDKTKISMWLDSFADELKSVKKYLRKLNTTYKDLKYYIQLNLIYSILLDADKSDVVINDSKLFVRNIALNSSLVDLYKEKKFKKSKASLNTLKNKAYEEIMSKSIDLSTKVYALNLPTGMGKTLALLAYALKLREKIKNKKGLTPRIIYTLPFLSIIDQNSKVFEDVLAYNGIKASTDIILKHNHLTDIFYTKKDSVFEQDASEIFIEGWNSEIVVTTFVQFFHSVLSNKNRNLRKFHRIANSIIILDEIQTIPIKYWLLVKSLLSKMAKKMNAYIILSTATQPLIFEEKTIKSLVNKDLYFNTLNRVSLIPVLDKEMSIEELSNYFDLNNGKTYLFILNTINSAKELYNLIKSKNVTYLSTHITPKERLKRIQDIKNRVYQVVVTTQLIEAGVDIDFDIVVRDLAPLDSINQAAGRCNRNNIGNNKGYVYIVILKNKIKNYSSYIYDSVLLHITKNILKSKKIIHENEFLNLIEKYYKETKTKKVQDTALNIIDAINCLRYNNCDGNTNRKSINDFKLIESYQKLSVFIEEDAEAQEIWARYVEIKKIPNKILRKKSFDLIKRVFYQYVISIPENTDNLPPIDGIGYVEHTCLGSFYHPITGYISNFDNIRII